MKVTSFSKIILSVAAVFFMASFTGARAQTAAPAATAAKVGVINIRNAIINTAEGKQAQAQLQSEFAPKQNDLQNTQKEIDDVQRKMNEGARTLSQDEQARLQREGELLTRKFQRGQDELNDDVQAAQTDLIDSIGRKMIDIIDRYGRENGFTVILDTSAQGTPVVYAATELDVTDEIVRLYDQQYPVKASAATPAVAPSAAAPAPKPAAPGAPAAPKKANP